MKALVLLDDDRVPVKAGDTVRFNYGIPPVVVDAKIVQRRGLAELVNQVLVERRSVLALINKTLCEAALQRGPAPASSSDKPAAKPTDILDVFDYWQRARRRRTASS